MAKKDNFELITTFACSEDGKPLVCTYSVDFDATLENQRGKTTPEIRAEMADLNKITDKFPLQRVNFLLDTIVSGTDIVEKWDCQRMGSVQTPGNLYKLVGKNQQQICSLIGNRNNKSLQGTVTSFPLGQGDVVCKDKEVFDKRSEELSECKTKLKERPKCTLPSAKKIVRENAEDAAKTTKSTKKKAQIENLLKDMKSVKLL